MSFCRWSCDNFKSDIYCYEDSDGTCHTHVAPRRHVGEIPVVEWGLRRTNPEKLLQQRKALARFLENCETVEINHPLAGQTIVDPSLTSLRVRLFTLRTEGFYVPDSAIRAVDVEIARRAIN